MPWKPERTGTFKREYRKLGLSIQDKVGKAVTELLASKDPRKLGHALSGRWEGCYSYVLDHKFRLIYAVNFKKRTIYFFSVGPHTIYR